MLWQRSRRIGALQGHLGAFDWHLKDPASVGKREHVEVMLCERHTEVNDGGATAVGIVSSVSIAEHPHLYVGEFEAPAICALDAVAQLCHCSAAHHQLIAPWESSAAENEQLHALAWVTRTPPPYVPLEVDLPFKLQLSRPSVCHSRPRDDPGSLVGATLFAGAPMQFFEYNVMQGAEHYVFDDSPSSRPMKWWSQKNNFPMSGHLWVARTGQLRSLKLLHSPPNPFDPQRRRPLHLSVKPTPRAVRRVRTYQQRLAGKGKRRD